MPEVLAHYFSERQPLDLLRDALDIAVVSYVFYRLLLVAKGTRAVQIAAGLGVVFLMYLVAEFLGLRAVETLVRAPLESILVVSVVIFQNDIRRALERVGGSSLLGGLGRAQETEVIDAVVEAARELARHRIGALITFQQEANLDEFVGHNRGIELDAKVSATLLVSLFLPEALNKFHDGSVILRNLRVSKAGVFFPMPETKVSEVSLGSRHRAAIGITEQTDAVVVVVSEERGTISFCFNGNIATDLQAPQLRDMLLSILNPKIRKKARKASKGPSLPQRHSEYPPPVASARRDSEIPPPVSSVPPPLRKGNASGPDSTSDVPSIPRAPLAPRPMPKAASRSGATDAPGEEGGRD